MNFVEWTHHGVYEVAPDESPEEHDPGAFERKSAGDQILMFPFRTILPVVLMVAIVGIGLYHTPWVMLIGDIVETIEQIRSEQIVVLAVAWCVLKMVLYCMAAYIAATPFFLLGNSLDRDHNL